MMESKIVVKFTIKDLLIRIGITKPHHLWKVMGGSKQHAGTLFEGNIRAISFDTIESLLEILRRESPGSYKIAVKKLNESGLFTIEGPGI